MPTGVMFSFLPMCVTARCISKSGTVFSRTPYTADVCLTASYSIWPSDVAESHGHEVHTSISLQYAAQQSFSSAPYVAVLLIKVPDGVLL